MGLTLYFNPIPGFVSFMSLHPALKYGRAFGSTDFGHIVPQDGMQRRTKNATVCIRWSYPADVTTHQKRARPVKSHGDIVGDGEVGQSIGLHGHNLCSPGMRISASGYV